jgi:hypothetical protein
MAAGSTYTPIATTTLGSAAASYTFSSISGSYTDLVVVVNSKRTSAGNLAVQFNGDTGSNYSYTYLYGSGSAASSSRGSNQSDVVGDYYASGTWGITTVNVMNYSNSTTYKTSLFRGNDGGGNGVMTTVTLWRNTAAITSILVKNSAGNLDVGTTLTLYGIAAA